MSKPIFDIVPPEPKKPTRKVETIATGYEEARPVPIRKEASPTVEVPELSEERSEDAFLERLATDHSSEAPWTRPSTKFGKRLVVIVIAVATVVILGWIFTKTISRATITLVVDRAFQPFSFDVTLDRSVKTPDFAQRRLPLQYLRESVELTKEYPATGEGTVSTKARGRVVIYNTYSPASQVLVANTRLQAPDGKIFRITNRIVIPGNGSTSAEVVADQAGPAYNIGPTRFTIPGFQGSPRYEKIYAESFETFRGGASGKTRIVTAADIQQAQQDISKTAFDTLNNNLGAKVPRGYIWLEQGATRLSVLSLTSEARAGDALSTFKVGIKSEAEALIFDEAQIRGIAQQIIGTKTNLSGLNEVEFVFAYNPKKLADFGRGLLELKVDGAINVAESIDVMRLKQSLIGKNEPDVKKVLLALPGVKEARVVLWPAWTRTMPQTTGRITIDLK